MRGGGGVKQKNQLHMTDEGAFGRTQAGEGGNAAALNEEWRRSWLHP